MMDTVDQSEVGDARQSRVSTTANAEEDVRMPLASTTANAEENYGSISEEKPKSPQELFLEKMRKYGGPMVLLIQAWAALMPVIAPLLLVEHTSLRTGDFNLRCPNLPNFTPQRLLCDITLPAVCFFPGVCQSMAMGLVTWRLVRQRLFYVFLQRRILIDFDNSTYLARMVTFTILSMFALSMVHFGLLLTYGHASGETWLKGLNKGKVGGGNDFILKTSVWNLIKNPESLLDDENKILILFITKLAVLWIVPAVVAIAFTQDIDDTETTLVPLPKLYEDVPHYVYQHLGESVTVNEDVAREVLQCDEEETWLTQHLNKMRQSDAMVRTTSLAAVEIKQVDIDKACDSFRKEVFSFEGVSLIGAQAEADIETAPPLGCQKVSLPPETLLDMATKTWWPLHIILKDDPSDKEGLQFHKAWVIHCVLCSLVLGADCVLKVNGLLNAVADLARPAGVTYFGVDGLMVYWPMGFAITVTLVMAIRGLLHTAYDNGLSGVKDVETEVKTAS